MSKVLAKTTFFPIQIKNNSNLVADDEIFIVGKGVDPDNETTTIGSRSVDLECFLSFNANGEASFVPAKASGDPVPSVKLSDLPKLQDGGGDTVFQLKLPKITAGRFFISLQQPLPLMVVEGKNAAKQVVALTIAEDDPYQKGNTAFGMIYDKVEFTFNDKGIWINTTAVDFFSMPLGLKLSDGAKTTGLSIARNTVINDFNKGIDGLKNTAGLNTAGQAMVEEWRKCLVEQNGTILRIIAPNKAFGRPNAAEDFDHDYLNDYIDQVWSFYGQAGNAIEVDCKELVFTPQNNFILADIQSNGGKLIDQESSYIFKGTVDGNNNFVFKNSLSTPDVIPIGKPASNQVFGGDGGPFTAKVKHASSVIVRELASALNVGLLPLSSSPTVPRLNKAFFISSNNKFYTQNSLLPAKVLNSGIWYNAYSKLLHSFNQPVYTYAFDDALGQDGTLSSGNVTSPPIGSVVIGDMTGTKLPNTGKDTNQYTITLIAGNNCNGSIIHANGTKESFNVPAGQPPKVFSNVSSPFQVEYDFSGQKTYTITMLTQVIDPSLGVNFAKGASATEWTLSFPGKASKNAQ